MTKIVFLDIETTGLDPRRHQILEVAMIVRGTEFPDDKTINFSLPIIESLASPKALEVNRYHERRDQLRKDRLHPILAENVLRDALAGAVVVGNNPQFDLRFIEQWFAANTWRADDAERDDGATPWHYHPVDLKALVAGRMGMGPPPWSTSDIAREAGVPLPEGYHSAAVDAAWNRDVYDAVMNYREPRLPNGAINPIIEVD